MDNSILRFGNLEVLVQMLDEIDDEILVLVKLAETLEYDMEYGNLTDIIHEGYREKQIDENGDVLLSIEKEKNLEVVQFRKERMDYILEVMKEDMLKYIWKNRNN